MDNRRASLFFIDVNCNHRIGILDVQVFPDCLTLSTYIQNIINHPKIFHKHFVELDIGADVLDNFSQNMNNLGQQRDIHHPTNGARLVPTNIAVALGPNLAALAGVPPVGAPHGHHNGNGMVQAAPSQSFHMYFNVIGSEPTTVYPLNTVLPYGVFWRMVQMIIIWRS